MAVAAATQLSLSSRKHLVKHYARLEAKSTDSTGIEQILEEEVSRGRHDTLMDDVETDVLLRGGRKRYVGSSSSASEGEGEDAEVDGASIEAEAVALDRKDTKVHGSNGRVAFRRETSLITENGPRGSPSSTRALWQRAIRSVIKNVVRKKKVRSVIRGSVGLVRAIAGRLWDDLLFGVLGCGLLAAYGAAKGIE